MQNLMSMHFRSFLDEMHLSRDNAPVRMSAERTRFTRRHLIILLLLLVALYGVFYAFSLHNPEQSECLTESYCINAREHAPLMAAVKLVTVIIILATAFGTWFFSAWLFARGLLIPFAGFLLIAGGVVGIISLFAFTPRADLKNYTHVTVICGILILIGLWIVGRGLRERGRGERSDDDAP